MVIHKNILLKSYMYLGRVLHWENKKSLPDIHNLLMMCELFNVTLDDLVKGTINCTYIKCNEVLTYGHM